MMEFKEITGTKQQDSFVSSQPRSQFLQSWRWGEFQKSQNNQVVRFALFENNRILGSAQVVQQNLPLGRKYWYCPRGPVADVRLPVNKRQAVWRQLVAGIANCAVQGGAFFLKLEPPVDKFKEELIIKRVLAEYNYRKAPAVQPVDTWYLDLEKAGLGDLLSAMHPKTRYNIKLAERKGVQIRNKPMVGDFEIFWELVKKTSERDKFGIHSRAYYRDMYRLLSGSGFVSLYLAEYKGQVIATNLVVKFGDTVTYLHGASANEFRNVMAPHLLQWKQIKDAKEAGYKYYDFWGVGLPGTKKEASWAGITRFKRGFGGDSGSFPGAFDLILDEFWYRLYKAARAIKF